MSELLEQREEIHLRQSSLAFGELRFGKPASTICEGWHTDTMKADPE